MGVYLSWSVREGKIHDLFSIEGIIEADRSAGEHVAGLSRYTVGAARAVSMTEDWIEPDEGLSRYRAGCQACGLSY